MVKENSIQKIINFFPSRKESVLTEKQKQQRSDILNNLKSIEMNGVFDLFLISENETVQLSDFNMINKDCRGTFNTDLLHDLNRWGIPGVNLSPDLSKLIFNYPIEFYDIVHGPTFIVNMTGGNQKILMVDGNSREESKPIWLPDGNNILFVQRDENDINRRGYSLYITVNEENDFMLIDDHVDYFKIKY